MQTENTKENLCDSCKINNYPDCLPEVYKVGDGVGNDNITECQNYENYE
jgi:hypothetical protein